MKNLRYRIKEIVQDVLIHYKDHLNLKHPSVSPKVIHYFKGIPLSILHLAIKGMLSLLEDGLKGRYHHRLGHKMLHKQKISGQAQSYGVGIQCKF